MCFVTVGIAAGTSMPETAVKFVNGVCSDIETVHMKVGARDANLPGIAGMLNVVGLLLGTPSEPFQGYV